MQTANKPYKPGQWILLGTALGTFGGILLDSLALGMIFGFFLGAIIDSQRRRAAEAAATESAED